MNPGLEYLENENGVVLTTVGSTPGVVSSVREFDAVSGPKLNFDVELKKK